MKRPSWANGRTVPLVGRRLIAAVGEQDLLPQHLPRLLALRRGQLLLEVRLLGCAEDGAVGVLRRATGQQVMT